MAPEGHGVHPIKHGLASTATILHSIWRKGNLHLCLVVKLPSGPNKQMKLCWTADSGPGRLPQQSPFGLATRGPMESTVQRKPSPGWTTGGTGLWPVESMLSLCSPFGVSCILEAAILTPKGNSYAPAPLGWKKGLLVRGWTVEVGPHTRSTGPQTRLNNYTNSCLLLVCLASWGVRSQLLRASSPGPLGRAQPVAGAESEGGQWKQAHLLGLHGPRTKLNSTNLCVILVFLALWGLQYQVLKGFLYSYSWSTFLEPTSGGECSEAGAKWWNWSCLLSLRTKLNNSRISVYFGCVERCLTWSSHTPMCFGRTGEGCESKPSTELPEACQESVRHHSGGLFRCSCSPELNEQPNDHTDEFRSYFNLSLSHNVAVIKVLINWVSSTSPRYEVYHDILSTLWQTSLPIFSWLCTCKDYKGTPRKTL